MKNMFKAVFLILVGFILFGCNSQHAAQKQVSVSSIEVVSSNLHFDQNFKLSDIKINVLKDDGSDDKINSKI